MSSELDDAATRETQRLHAEWMADSRLVTERVGKWVDCHCAGCGVRLTFAESELKARGLARVNATARPCCDLWRARK